MRFIVLVQGVKETEKVPTLEDVAEMGKFNDELIKAGVMLSGEGLSQTKEGARLRWGKNGVSVVDGPFAEAKELVAGFWIIEARSRAEAIEWMRRAPFPEGGQVEIRRIADLNDFAPESREELARQEKAWIAQLDENKNKRARPQ